MEALRAAAQDRGVTGLEAERAGVGRHRRPAFEDDADHAERHGDALDDEAVGPLEAGQHPVDGIGQRRDRLEARGDTRNASSIEREPIDEGRWRAPRRRLGDVAAVGGEDLVAARAHAGSRVSQRGGAIGVGGGGKRAGGVPRGASQGGHHGVDVGLDRGALGFGELQLFHRCAYGAGLPCCNPLAPSCNHFARHSSKQSWRHDTKY